LAAAGASYAGAASAGRRSGRLALSLAAVVVPAAVALLPVVLNLFGSLARRRGLLQLVRLILVFELDKVRYIQKRIALQAEVDKCRLHAGQNARYSSVVYGPCEGVLVFAFVINFRELIVF
jgi:hypothetical protein